MAIIFQYNSVMINLLHLQFIDTKVVSNDGSHYAVVRNLYTLLGVQVVPWGNLQGMNLFGIWYRVPSPPPIAGCPSLPSSPCHYLTLSLLPETVTLRWQRLCLSLSVGILTRTPLKLLTESGSNSIEMAPESPSRAEFHNLTLPHLCTTVGQRMGRERK